MLLVSNRPSSADAVCVAESLLVQVTVVPTLTCRFAGWNEKSLTVTASPATGLATVVVDAVALVLGAVVVVDGGFVVVALSSLPPPPPQPARASTTTAVTDTMQRAIRSPAPRARGTTHPLGDRPRPTARGRAAEPVRPPGRATTWPRRRPRLPTC